MLCWKQTAISLFCIIKLFVNKNLQIPWNFEVVSATEYQCCCEIKPQPSKMIPWGINIGRPVNWRQKRYGSYHTSNNEL